MVHNFICKVYYFGTVVYIVPTLLLYVTIVFTTIVVKVQHYFINKPFEQVQRDSIKIKLYYIITKAMNTANHVQCSNNIEIHIYFNTYPGYIARQ